MRPGDRVALLSPSSPARHEDLEAALAQLETWGLRPDLLAAGPADRYLAGPDAVRCESLRRALQRASGYRAVLCSRGGYGAMRLLEGVDWARDLEPAPPGPDAPWLVGGSDVTALLAARTAAGFPGCVYGPMPATPAFQGEDPTNREALRRLLFGQERCIRLQGRPVQPGDLAHGPLQGGCLSLLGALLGTPLAPDLAGSVLVLEDVGEAPYRLDRLLTSLRLSGRLQGVLAIAVGSLHRCGLSPPEEDALLEDRLGDLGIPVVAGLGFGHGERQQPLLLGGPPARLDPGAGLLEQPLA